MSTGKGGRYAPPAPIAAQHDTGAFRCGKPVLDDWLAKRALAAEGRTARTYVVTSGEGRAVVAGYYSLATAAVERREAPGAIRRNAPDPLPAMLLARLAVDQRHQGNGLGPAMLKEAMARTAEASRIAGVRLLIVHPLDGEAGAFYARFGFAPLGDGRAMFLPVETIVAAL